MQRWWRFVRVLRRFAAPTRADRPRASRVPAMHSANPLAHGNRFQRAYYRWALPYYERYGQQDPALRERVELIDIHLYSRRGLGAWVGWLLGLAGTVAWVLGKGATWGFHTSDPAVVDGLIARLQAEYDLQPW